MFDKFRLQEALVKYKQNFVSQWKKEKYKWEAVKVFQDNWNVNAADFTAMLSRSISKTSNLLASNNNFPAEMIKQLAATVSEQVRTMFIALFDENKDVVERIIDFKNQASKLWEKYGNGNNHYQNENAISTYLWLRYPNKYYIYKYKEVEAVAKELGCGIKFKKGDMENLRNFFALYNEICDSIKNTTELTSMLETQLDDSCYPDHEYRTLTIDFGFFISRNLSSNGTESTEDEWFPLNYSPEISVDEWVTLLGDDSIFTPNTLEIMKRIKDYGGQATCKQLSAKYGESKNFYNSGSAYLARRIANKTNCPRLETNNKNSKWWPILYLGKNATKDVAGSYIWKLRDELSQALDMINLSNVKLYASATAQAEKPLPLAENIKKYTSNDFLNEVYMSKKAYAELTDILKRKKNIILQGAPGVGKTFTAKRLAYSMMGEKDENRIEFVQFHQNYTYEDFVIGYKPDKDGGGFTLKNGIFYSFCQKAASDSDRDYFFIIDEINRGNMSKIFGELLMLIENNHRGTSLTLACNNSSFSVPKNLYIIGMMNTADRSLAMIDYALRRRFSFFNIAPGFDSDGFAAYQQNLNSKKLNDLVKELENLNLDIADDKSLGQGFCIGHSYLCGENNCTDAWLQGVVKYDILPMLAEYWFDDMEKYDQWANRLTDAVK